MGFLARKHLPPKSRQQKLDFLFLFSLLVFNRYILRAPKTDVIPRIFRQVAVAVSGAQIDRRAAVTSAANDPARLYLPVRIFIEKIAARDRIYLNLSI